MKLHFGTVVRQMSITTQVDGYWFKDATDVDYSFVKQPETKVRDITSLYGVSTNKSFFGIIKYTTSHKQR